MSHIWFIAPGTNNSPHDHTQMQMENWIELEALAVAKRRRDMPRLSEKHGEEGSSADEEEAADDDMKVRCRDEGLYGWVDVCMWEAK